jgi:CheY-like chemotaxis protein
MKKILIVGNDRESAAGTADVLREAIKNAEIDVCLGGKCALECLKKRACDLVVVRNGLADMTGLELLEAMSELGGRWPVIILSISGRADEALKYMRLGAYDYLTDDSELADSARGALDLGYLLEGRKRAAGTNISIIARDEDSRIARVFSDEVNNPLMTIIGNVQLLLVKCGPDNEELRSRLTTIEESARRIARAMALFMDNDHGPEDDFPRKQIKRENNTTHVARL